MINNLESFEEVMAILRTEPVIAFDFETMPLDKYSSIDKLDASLHHKMCEIEGLSLRSARVPACYIPFKDTSISRVTLFESISKLFRQDSLFVAHNMSFDAKMADYFFGVRPKNKFCTLVGYWYLNENSRKSKVALAKDVFGLDLISYKEAKKIGEEEFTAYAERDAEFAWNLYWYIKEKLPKKLYELAATLEMDFVDVLIDMCLYGTHVDLENLKVGEKVLTDALLALEAKIYRELGEFNIGSPQQLCEKLYGIKVTRKKATGLQMSKVEGYSTKKYAKPPKLTKTGAPSTDDKTLAKLDTPAAKLIQEYREIDKLLSTYATGYQKWIINGRVYPAFNHVGAVTGRLSSSNPNMQNIPRERSKYLIDPNDETSGWWLRDAIYAPEGYDLIVADESQLEIRVLAHFCQDSRLMEAIFSGEDIHLATAKIIFGKDDISKQERTFAKTMNFAIIYGRGVNNIAADLKITFEEALAFRKRYFDTFPGIKDYIEECTKKMVDKGFVKTLLGRRRRIPEIYSNDNGEFARAKRQTVNSVIQGSASDVLKVAMVNINQEFKDKNLDAHILIQVHDELVIESKKEYTNEAMEIVQRHMEHPFNDDLRVPLLVEPKICKIWSEGK